MKYLGAALAISFGMGLVLFVIVYPLFHDAHLAAGIAAIPIAGCHHIAEMLERRETRQGVTAHRAAEIHDLAGFSVAWPLIVAYATIALFGIYLVATVFGALTIGFLFDEGATYTRRQAIGVMVIAAPILLIGGFMVGRWIGSRCARWSEATILLITALGPLVGGAFGALFGLLMADTSPPVLGRTPLQEFFVEWLVPVCTFAAAGLLGQRQGRKRRLADYMEYLLSVLPPPTRNVLVELAFEEARKAGAAGPPAGAAGR